MRKIKFIFPILALAILFGCDNSTSNPVNEKEIEKSTVIIDLEQDGVGYELKVKDTPYITSRAFNENTEQYYLTVYREDDKNINLKAIIVKENIDPDNYILYHYTEDKVLFATITVSHERWVDLKLEFDDENFTSTRSLKSWYACANQRYKEYKKFYDDNHPIICALGDMAGGACTIGGIMSGVLFCTF